MKILAGIIFLALACSPQAAADYQPPTPTWEQPSWADQMPVTVTQDQNYAVPSWEQPTWMGPLS